MFDLTNKTAIITGGAGVLGQHFSQTLVDANANLVIIDISYDRVHEAAANIFKKKPNAKILPLECNICDKNAVDETISKITHRFNNIDILLNNATTKTSNLKNFFAPFEEYSLETWREVMAVNIDGMFLVAQAVSKEMIKHNTGGAIIQVSSIYGVVAPDQRIYSGSEYMGVEINTPAVYSASKGAVLSFTKYLATYLAKYNIRVNSLTPGGIESGQNNTFIDYYSSKVPLNRMGKYSELAGALLFLASDASSYVTGQNIIVDGGFTCW